MKIYTKTGDKGTTSLLGGKRVSKAHIRIEAYGTLDELNCHIGLLRDQEVNRAKKDFLIKIQNDLFSVGSLLAADPEKPKLKLPELTEKDIFGLELEIDAMEKGLPPMKFFVLPGGNQSVSFCHIARTVCRRAERLCISLNEETTVPDFTIQFINRLSDYLFVLSRWMTLELKAEEIPWIPEKK